MKKKPLIVALIVAVLLILAYAATFLYERSKVAMIIDDESVWDVLDSLSCATQMKVVILPDGTVARYLSEDDLTYTVSVQDSFSVPKEGAKVETWSASEGKGRVFMKEPGMVQVLYEPDIMAGVKCNLTYEEGECPCTYKCLGLKDGWYEVELWEEESGYIQAQYLGWDAIDTF